MAIKAVIFDLDGTLIDTIQELANATNYALTKMGCPNWTVTDYRGFVGNGITKLLLRSLPEDRRSEIQTARAFFNEYYTRHLLDTMTVYRGIPELMNWLLMRGIRIAVNTNKANDFANRIIGKAFPGKFEKVIGDEGGFPRKPQPDAALYLAKMMNAAPEECVFMGDSGVDIETAQNAGMTSVVGSWGFVYKNVLETLPHQYIIDTPMELTEIIRRKNV